MIIPQDIIGSLLETPGYTQENCHKCQCAIWLDPQQAQMVERTRHALTHWDYLVGDLYCPGCVSYGITYAQELNEACAPNVPPGKFGVHATGWSTRGLYMHFHVLPNIFDTIVQAGEWCRVEIDADNRARHRARLVIPVSAALTSDVHESLYGSVYGFVPDFVYGILYRRPDGKLFHASETASK